MTCLLTGCFVNMSATQNITCNSRVNGEKCVVNDVNEVTETSFEDIDHPFTWRDWEKPLKHEPKYSVFPANFERKASGIQVRSFTAWDNLFCKKQECCCENRKLLYVVIVWCNEKTQHFGLGDACNEIHTLWLSRLTCSELQSDSTGKCENSAVTFTWHITPLHLLTRKRYPDRPLRTHPSPSPSSNSQERSCGTSQLRVRRFILHEP